MQTLFLRKTLFFVGASLGGITDYLEVIDFAQFKSDRKHFALVGETEQIDSTQALFLKRQYNVEVIPFKPKTNWFEQEITEFVSKTHGLLRRTSGPNQQPQQHLITRVEVENIGPFAKQSFTFTDGWNVLLGNNGVGKSVILRAVAAALTGQIDDPDAVLPAQRLLKSGTDKGWIVVSVGKDDYRMDIQRDAAGNVVPRWSGLSAITMRKWLVLGFPALRALAPRKRQSDRQSKPEPSYRDVVPMLTGMPDQRLDNLEQWVEGLEVKRKLKGRAGDEAERLFKDLFEVLRKMIPGVYFDFDRFDSVTRQMWIRTADGTVPVEVISQGTVSVICWVGVLLQRLYEVHPDTDDYKLGAALVLVDEVDAHMHPAWQRRFATQLASIFPNVQVLATTHSPLIVGSLDREQITILKSWSKPGTPNLRDIVVSQPNRSFKGFRADQTLTSEVFDLEATRSEAVEEAMDRHAALGWRDDLEPDEQAELERLSKQLEVDLPSTGEREEARKAYQLIADSLQHRFEAMPDDERLAVQESMKRQLLRVSQSESTVR
jgi:hypothetical protein